MKLFNLDSPVMVFLSKVANLMILNVLTIICCIPIFTAGAAITALYYVTIKMARGDDPYIIKGYFKSFKENFKQATIIWLIMLVILAIIAVDWRVTLVMMTGNSAKIMKTVLFIVSFLLLLTGLYIFPVLSRFDNTVKNTFRNAFLISFMNLPKSVLIVIIHLIRSRLCRFCFFLESRQSHISAVCCMSGSSNALSLKNRYRMARTWLPCPLS